MSKTIRTTCKRVLMGMACLATVLSTVQPALAIIDENGNIGLLCDAGGTGGSGGGGGTGGSGGGPGGSGGGTSGSGPTTFDWMARGDAVVADQVGFVITNTSGVDTDGYIQTFSIKSAFTPREPDGSPSNIVGAGAVWRIGLEFGQDSGWYTVNKTAIVNYYNASVTRSNDHSQQIALWRQEAHSYASYYESSTDPIDRATWLTHYQSALDNVHMYYESYDAELKFQRTLKPGF